MQAIQAPGPVRQRRGRGLGQHQQRQRERQRAEPKRRVATRANQRGRAAWAGHLQNTEPVTEREGLARRVPGGCTRGAGALGSAPVRRSRWSGDAASAKLYLADFRGILLEGVQVVQADLLNRLAHASCCGQKLRPRPLSAVRPGRGRALHCDDLGGGAAAALGRQVGRRPASAVPTGPKYSAAAQAPGEGATLTPTRRIPGRSGGPGPAAASGGYSGSVSWHRRSSRAVAQAPRPRAAGTMAVSPDIVAPTETA
mmetsp:Transcript_43835/g.121257  ORF Transcript_43835/g.121257 Transcript_43835/m.121257 type:complete len:255 (+) Transcript_43835:823-1587(+)